MSSTEAYFAAAGEKLLTQFNGRLKAFNIINLEVVVGYDFQLVDIEIGGMTLLLFLESENQFAYILFKILKTV